uniref:Uncharacterized protein n=1 Tax=Arundo donax TaxID=35708 RepID=A0A0A9H9D4_ARUDO
MLLYRLNVASSLAMHTLHHLVSALLGVCFLIAGKKSKGC